MTTRVHPLGGAVIVAACLAPACAGPRAGERLDVVVSGAVELGSGLAEELDQMRAAYARGDEDQARVALAAARARPQTAALDAYLTQFESLLDGRALVRSLERQSEIVADHDPVTLGDPITMRAVLRCDAVGGRAGKVEIVAETGGGLLSSRPRSQTRIVAEVSAREVDAYGREATHRETLLVAPHGDIVIPEEGEATIALSFEGLSNDGVAARFVSVQLEILPVEVRFAGTPVSVTRFTLPACAVTALPPEHATFARDPLKALAEILERPDVASDRSILAASLVVPPEDREAALRQLCVKLLGASASRSLAVMTAMRELTGNRDFGLDRAAWVGFATKVLTEGNR